MFAELPIPMMWQALHQLDPANFEQGSREMYLYMGSSGQGPR